jgi:pimeloyl-ACP methyl ester carboxylesterase
MKSLPCIVVTLMLSAVSMLTAPAALADPSLPRRNSASIEPLERIETQFGELATPRGHRLRTIATRPAGTRRRLPAVYFVQWLSCDTVEIGAGSDGWTQMLTTLVRDSGLVVMRLDKAGVGDSEGDCATLDYETELTDHRLALQSLYRNRWVDPNRIFVFGASMGANFAPLVAEGARVRGVAVWGGGAQSWFERQLGFERRAMEWSGASGAEIDARMRVLSRAYAALLLDRRGLGDVAATDSGLVEAWGSATGADGETQFGRPLLFHQQAQARNWAQAWERVDAPVLALFGEYDWYEDPAGVELIGAVVSRRRPGAAAVHIVPGLDHHFTRYRSRQDAFREENGEVDSRAVTDILLPWLATHAR